MENYTIYMHTTPSGKVYIGQTSLNPEQRWQNGKGYKYCKLFYPEIEKYGWGKIAHKILHTNLSSLQAFILENLYICFFKEKRISLNIADAGDKISKFKETPNIKRIFFDPVIKQFDIRPKEVIKKLRPIDRSELLKLRQNANTIGEWVQNVMDHYQCGERAVYKWFAKFDIQAKAEMKKPFEDKDGINEDLQKKVEEQADRIWALERDLLDVCIELHQRKIELNNCKKELIDRTKELIDCRKELIVRIDENAELKKQLAAKNTEQHIDSGRQFKNFCWTQSVYDINPTREDLMELKAMSENHKHFIDLIKLNYKCTARTAYRWLKKFNIPSDRRRRGE